MGYNPITLVKSATWLRRLINFWPPFVGAGIKVTRLDDDFKACQVRMKLHWYNRNYLGTQYGGSLFSMTDAFYVIMIIHQIGSKYYVWDQRASIDYITPARGTVYANYTINEGQINEIIKRCENGEKYLFNVPVEIIDEKNTLIAKVEKVIYVRKKSKFRNLN